MEGKLTNPAAYDKLDVYWRAVADFIRPVLAGTDRLIAPPEFAGCFPSNQCHACDDRLSGKYQWVILHKGRLRETEERGVFALCLALEPVFANEVFVVFAVKTRTKRLPDTNLHYQSFLSVLEDQFAPACLAGKWESFHIPQAQPRPAVYLGDHCVLTRTVHGQAIYVDTRDLSVAPRLILDGRWEEETTEVFTRSIQPGATVLEVGANAGYYTLLAASKVGPGGKVIAFEANRNLCDLLFKSIFINGFNERCELINKAVTDRSGTVAFQRLQTHLGGSSVAPMDPAYLERTRESVEEVAVETVGLDAFIRERGLTHVNVIKIDAEGSEPLILKGLEQTLNTATDLTVIFELNAKSIRAMGQDPLEMLGSLIDKGFTLQRISPNGLIPLRSLEEALTWPICDILMHK